MQKWKDDRLLTTECMRLIYELKVTVEFHSSVKLRFKLLSTTEAYPVKSR